MISLLYDYTNTIIHTAPGFWTLEYINLLILKLKSLYKVMSLQNGDPSVNHVRTRQIKSLWLHSDHECQCWNGMYCNVFIVCRVPTEKIDFHKIISLPLQDVYLTTLMHYKTAGTIILVLEKTTINFCMSQCYYKWNKKF